MLFPGNLSDFQALINVIPNPVVVKNSDHRIVLINDQACEFFCRSREFLTSHRDEDLFPADQVAGFHEADRLVFESGVLDEREEQVSSGTGAVRHVVTRKQRVVLNGIRYLVAVVSDVTAYREAEERSRYLALHDALTGLPNRILFSEMMERTLPDNLGRCALLYVDLDRFKEVNDFYGHPVGDELIVQFARRLAGILRPCDILARIGGDEFSILLTDVVMRESVEPVCERIMAAASEPFDLSGSRVLVSASIGVVLPQGRPVAQIELQQRADIALHRAKADGRGRWCLYSEELGRQFRHRQLMEADLRDALAQKSPIIVHYQPLIDVQTSDIIGFEALVRWHHPVRGMISPDDFIPVAEASGLILQLGELVLERACRDAARWSSPLLLSVNVSPMQFAHGDLPGTIERVLAETGLDPARLELEITEGVLIDNACETLNLLNRIRALGVATVLDDFGTGYSSLGYLRRFPFDKVKIDRSFIADMLENQEAAAIVEAVMALGRSLNMPVVAEGVETPAQLDLLRGIGCAQAQGYLISRPMPIESFADIVHGNAAKLAHYC